MKKNSQLIITNPLFRGITAGDMDRMFRCMSVKTAHYQKDAILLMSGAAVDFIGLIMSGSLQIVKEEINGNSTILAKISVPELFGETFACAGVTESPVTIRAAEDVDVLFIDYRRIVQTCSSACPFHTRLIENMLSLIAQKNLMLSHKIDILSKRTTREKLLCFFDRQRGSSRSFTIPFNREEMASYLCVDRSAMSHELSKMRNEGLLRYQKNSFELLSAP